MAPHRIVLNDDAFTAVTPSGVDSPRLFAITRAIARFASPPLVDATSSRGPDESLAARTFDKEEKEIAGHYYFPSSVRLVISQALSTYSDAKEVV